MKKIFLLFVPLVAFADQEGVCRLESGANGEYTIVCEGNGLQLRYQDVTNQVYVMENCEALKSALLSSASSINSSARDIYQLQSDIETALYYPQHDPVVSTNANFQYFINEYNQAQSVIEPTLRNIINDTSSSGASDNIYNSINDIQCGSCPTNGASGGSGGGSGSCCDYTQILNKLTDIINRMITAEEQRAAIASQLGYILEGVVSIAGSMDKLVDGLVNITNLLSYVNYPDVHYFNMNKWGLQNLLGLRLGTGGFTINNMAINTAVSNSRDNGWLPSLWWQNIEQLKVLASLNNFEYFKYLYFNDPVTNNLISLHDASTNYFSFFRGELGVQGVLSDWTSEQASGSYHDFLTNHYITAVRGGSLSGNQSSKTNWFARIETLLAALVFTDSVETNTVDTSAGRQEREQLASSFETANQAASNFSDSFKSTSESIVSLYSSFFNTFENSAMPSHVVLMRMGGDSSPDVEISFQSDSVSVLVESCRLVSTFCWASVGIFLLYKFLVWAGRCVVVVCQFIYRVISSVFK